MIDESPSLHAGHAIKARTITPPSTGPARRIFVSASFPRSFARMGRVERTAPSTRLLAEELAADLHALAIGARRARAPKRRGW